MSHLAGTQRESSPPIRCTICGTANDPAALFCAGCTAPVAVVGLHELDGDDHRQCLAALFQILADLQANPLPATPADHDAELWNAYLSAFWLRPETALVLYAEALAIAALANRLHDPWLDLGCGDGIHAALYSGWRFDPAFDAFQSLDLLAADIFDRWDPADFSVCVAERGRALAYGIDVKRTAVARAGALGVFDKVHQADAAHFPLPDRRVGVIFSNMLRDLGQPLGAALDECRRVLADDGTLLISAMTPVYARNLYFAPLARQAEAQGNEARARKLLRLDRGRSIFCRRQLSVEVWQTLLAEHGLQVAEVRPIIGAAAIRFWDVGLRPFSISLLHQRQAWKAAGILPQMKKAAVDTLGRVLEPLVRGICEGEVCMNLLAVTKS